MVVRAAAHPRTSASQAAAGSGAGQPYAVTSESSSSGSTGSGTSGGGGKRKRSSHHRSSSIDRRGSDGEGDEGGAARQEGSVTTSPSAISQAPSHHPSPSALSAASSMGSERHQQASVTADGALEDTGGNLREHDDGPDEMDIELGTGDDGGGSPSSSARGGMMVTPCRAPGCTKRPSFGGAGELKASYCGAHKVGYKLKSVPLTLPISSNWRARY